MSSSKNVNGSYQHGSEVEPLFQSNAIGLDYFEEKRRRRLCFILILSSFFLALIGAVAVFHGYLVQQERANQAAAVRATQALNKLNAHLKQVSKSVTEGCESTLLIMRHCEKYDPYVPDDDGTQHCSYLGYERSKFVATLFGNGSERWPAPAHLYAYTPSRMEHWNFREWETLKPLADKIGIVVDIVDGSSTLAAEYFDMLRSGSICGHVTVVSWKHSIISELAISLGCGPDNGCYGVIDENEYDQVWQLKFVFHPNNYENYQEEKNALKNKNSTGRVRALKSMSNVPLSRDGWNVYATITKLDFDPLAFSKISGDYPATGSAAGAHWESDGGEM